MTADDPGAKPTPEPPPEEPAPPPGTSIPPPPPPPPTPATPEQAEASAIARAALTDHRKWLLGIDYDSAGNFDKVLTTLSAGALGLSVSFGQGKSAWLLGLKLSWACFTASLLAMVFSYSTARRELEREFKAIDWKLSHRDDEKPPEARKPRYEITTYALNITALVGLIAGICLLIAFAAMNV